MLSIADHLSPRREERSPIWHLFHVRLEQIQQQWQRQPVGNTAEERFRSANVQAERVYRQGSLLRKP